MYTLLGPYHEERNVADRDQAIADARAWSAEGREVVVVTRSDGRVKMTFEKGRLVDYVYDSRKKGSR